MEFRRKVLLVLDGIQTEVGGTFSLLFVVVKGFSYSHHWPQFVVSATLRRHENTENP